MPKNTSILLGDYFEQFILRQVESGRFSSASEVIRTALRLFEELEKTKIELIEDLKAGEKSGFNSEFNKDRFIKNLEQKHSKK
jgi:antitoxin ParD1/3/4